MTLKRSEERGTDVERIRFFSDAVFAFAITLLVLDIRIPGGLSPEELTTALLGLWPKFLSYLLSFTIIGGYWRAYHRIFGYVRTYDGSFITLNLALLLCVAFLPFPVALFGEYTGQRVALAVYAGSVALTGAVLAGLWRYATRGGRLTGDKLQPGLVRRTMFELLVSPVLGLIVVPVTLVFGVRAAGYVIFPLLLILLVVGNVLSRSQTEH